MAVDKDSPPDALAQRAAALAELVERQLPFEADSNGVAAAWPLGPALLALATSSLKSIFRLREYEAHNDSSRLLRSLYDHVVTFAWLAVDPPPRLVVWYWIPRIDGFDTEGFKSLRGFCTVLFRQHSGLVHATMRGLNHVTVDMADLRKQVVFESPLDGERGPYAGGDGGAFARAGAAGAEPLPSDHDSALHPKPRQARGAVAAEPSTETATGDGTRGLAVCP